MTQNIARKVCFVDIDVLRRELPLSFISKLFNKKPSKSKVNETLYKRLRDKFKDVEFILFSLDPEDIEYYLGSRMDLQVWMHRLKYCAVISDKEYLFKNHILCKNLKEVLDSSKLEQLLWELDVSNIQQPHQPDHSKRTIFRRTSITRIQKKLTDK